MNEDNIEFSTDFGNGNQENGPIITSGEMDSGNIINDYSNDQIVSGNYDNQNVIDIDMGDNGTQINSDEPIQGPIIMDNVEENVGNNNNREKERQNRNDGNDENYKQLEDEIARLVTDREGIEREIRSLTQRKQELDTAIQSKQEELNYKKEVEVTADKLKTYIRDLEVNPGAVREALASLMNNM